MRLWGATPARRPPTVLAPAAHLPLQPARTNGHTNERTNKQTDRQTHNGSQYILAEVRKEPDNDTQRQLHFVAVLRVSAIHPLSQRMYSRGSQVAYRQNYEYLQNSQSVA